MENGTLPDSVVLALSNAICPTLFPPRPGYTGQGSVTCPELPLRAAVGTCWSIAAATEGGTQSEHYTVG